MPRYIRIVNEAYRQNHFRIVIHATPEEQRIYPFGFRYLKRNGCLSRAAELDYYNSYRYAVSVMKRYYPKFKTKVDHSNEYIKEVWFKCGS